MAPSRSAAGEGFGEVFKLTPADGGYNYTSWAFDGLSARTPSGSVAVGANGNLYGTAPEGGTGDWGVVWEITP